MCHAYRPESSWVSRHCLSINGKREKFTRNDLMTVAKRMSIKKAANIIDEVQSAVNIWEKFALEAGVETRLTKGIKETLLKL